MIVDGVAYTAAQIRRLVREHHDLTIELALCRDTLARRSAALDRVTADRDVMRGFDKPNP